MTSLTTLSVRELKEHIREIKRQLMEFSDKNTAKLATHSPLSRDDVLKAAREYAILARNLQRCEAELSKRS